MRAALLLALAACGSGPVAQTDDAWCVTRSWSSGDGGFTPLCFGADGVTEGGSGWAGAESHDAEFTLIRTEPRRADVP